MLHLFDCKTSGIPPQVKVLTLSLVHMGPQWSPHVYAHSECKPEAMEDEAPPADESVKLKCQLGCRGRGRGKGKGRGRGISSHESLRELFVSTEPSMPAAFHRVCPSRLCSLLPIPELTATYPKPDPHAVANRLGGYGHAFLHSASSRVAYQLRVATSKKGAKARIPRGGSCAAGTSASPDNLDSRKQTRASGMLKTSEAGFQLKQCGLKGEIVAHFPTLPEKSQSQEELPRHALPPPPGHDRRKAVPGGEMRV